MEKRPELYFPEAREWRDWLLRHHDSTPNGVYLIFFKLETEIPTMRWEEAVRVALCFGWIDSTVKSLGNGKRRQYFCPRNPKSSWSQLNKTYIEELEREGQIHPSGQAIIRQAKKNGAWNELDAVENGIIPPELQNAFDKNPIAWQHYQSFAPSYQKSYLYWLHGAKRPATRERRIDEIIRLCRDNKKSRS